MALRLVAAALLAGRWRAFGIAAVVTVVGAALAGGRIDLEIVSGRPVVLLVPLVGLVGAFAASGVESSASWLESGSSARAAAGPAGRLAVGVCLAIVLAVVAVHLARATGGPEETARVAGSARTVLFAAGVAAVLGTVATTEVAAGLVVIFLLVCGVVGMPPDSAASVAWSLPGRPDADAAAWVVSVVALVAGASAVVARATVSGRRRSAMRASTAA